MSPFKSGKQRRWMFANKPAMARRWARHGGATGGTKKGKTGGTSRRRKK